MNMKDAFGTVYVLGEHVNIMLGMFVNIYNTISNRSHRRSKEALFKWLKKCVKVLDEDEWWFTMRSCGNGTGTRGYLW